ncbi:MAG: TorF family putative porin [Lysobacteraceae bacterium]|jgi:conserved hypothetical protein, proteobacterial|nr:hypothetical protein [Xanthomonadaceae bacterium]
MKRLKLALPLAVVLSIVPFAASAQDGGSPFSWEVTAVSDYVWRGTSQSDENPTGQVGFTYTSPVGLYAGVWASGVDFGPGDPSYEVDGFIGYNVDLGESVNFDIMLNRYSYPDAGELNFNELITTTTFADTYSLTVAYSDDFGGSDTDAWYVAAGASFPLPQDFSLDLSVGRSMFEKDYSEDYTDWSIGVSRSWGLLTASLAYIGTDGNGRDIFGELADNRLVLSLSIGQ